MNEINLADETAEELSADEVAIICSFLPPKDIMRARVCLTGNIYSLRVLKDALEMVHIDQCRHIKGHLMDLADFPRLRELVLRRTKVTGDIRDIRAHHFSALESLYLPMSVHGGIDYEFQHISDMPDFMQTIHLLLDVESRPDPSRTPSKWFT